MRISGSKPGAAGRVGGASNAGGAERSSANFAVQGGGGARESAPAARAGGLSGVSSVDALLALQQLDGPLERRKRSMKRASRILDVLDEVKLSLLEGGAQGGGQDLSKLMDAVREQRSDTEDAGLEGVLDEIETRAAVEIAKREMRAA